MNAHEIELGPPIFIHSHHPLVLRMIEGILAATCWMARPLAKATKQDFEGSDWVVILDSFSVQDWLEMAIRCHSRSGLPIIIVPESPRSKDEELALVYLGVRGIILISNLEKELPQAVESVIKGSLWIHRHILDEYVKRANSAAEKSVLTIREQQIMVFLVRGLSNKEVSNALGISDRTVKFHVSNILQKLNIKSRKHLVKAPLPGNSKTTVMPPGLSA